MTARHLLAAATAGLLLLGGCGVAPVASETGPPTVTVNATTVSTPPASVSIPALHVTDQIVPVGLNPDRTMEIPPVNQVGWYRLGPTPGATGPAILAGHVNYNGVTGAFSKIGTLKAGDTITVTSAGGATSTFLVYDVLSFPKSRFDVAAVYGNTPGPELRLITCSGAVTDHEYADNTVVRARLVTS